MIENFDERINIRKQICEIKAQNYLNLQEIKHGEKLLSDLKNYRASDEKDKVNQKENIEY